MPVFAARGKGPQAGRGADTAAGASPASAAVVGSGSTALDTNGKAHSRVRPEPVDGRVRIGEADGARVLLHAQHGGDLRSARQGWTRRTPLELVPAECFLAYAPELASPSWKPYPRNSPPSTPRTRPPRMPPLPPRPPPITAFVTSFAIDRPTAELAERVAEVIALFHGLFAASRSA